MGPCSKCGFFQRILQAYLTLLVGPDYAARSHVVQMLQERVATYGGMTLHGFSVHTLCATCWWRSWYALVLHIDTSSSERTYWCLCLQQPEWKGNL